MNPRRSHIHFVLFLLATFCLSCCIGNQRLEGELYEVTLTGEVEFNLVSFGVLGSAKPGDSVGITFVVDEMEFVDSPNFPTRGYAIDLQSFVLDFGGGNAISLQEPFPSDQTPFFVIRNNDPAVDGFFVATNIDFPVGVPINQAGQFTQFINNFSVTYQGDQLNSLDIRNAEGSYDFDGLSVFNWTIDDGPFNATGFIFEQLIITPFGLTPCKFPLGDVNLDFEVNLLDVGPFVETIVNGNYQCEADTNLDGNVDLLDVDLFVAILAGG